MKLRMAASSSSFHSPAFLSQLMLALVKDVLSGAAANAVDVSQRDFAALVFRKVNTSYTSHVIEIKC